MTALTTKPAGYCAACGRTWTNLTACHCPTCHRTLANLAVWDQHSKTCQP